MATTPETDVRHPGSVAAQSQALMVKHKSRSGWSRSWSRFKRFKPGVVALFVIGFLTVVAIVPDLFAPYSYQEAETRLRGGSPSVSHPLGYDNIGRDILSRIIHGTRVAYTVAFIAMAVSLVIGVTVGALAGYFGGWVDAILSRITDALMAFPTLVLLLVLSAVFGGSVLTTALIIGVTVWSTYARVVRADVLSARERDYVLAAQSIGSSDSRIIFRHVLPNVVGPVIVIASLSVGSIIIFEAALSFLGLGVQPPTPSWGVMLSESRPFIAIYPHMPIAPGVMIFITVLAFNLIGDGLRDALDPRQKE